LVYLQKGKYFNAPEKVNHSGLHIHRPTNETVVAVVDPGSAGARAGIKPGDVVVSLAGLPADRTRLHVLRRCLCRGGETLPLTLKRGGKLLDVSLPLPADLPLTARANGKP
jgi:S1-C subfamily serine protease